MPEIPNVTGRIAQLREYKKSKSLTSAPFAPPPRKSGPPTKRPRARSEDKERKIATSYSVIAIYSVLFGALLAQLFLIAFLDLI